MSDDLLDEDGNAQSRRKLLKTAVGIVTLGLAGSAVSAKPFTGPEYIPIEIAPDRQIIATGTPVTFEVTLDAPPPQPVVVTITFEDPDGVMPETYVEVTVEPDMLGPNRKLNGGKAKTKPINVKRPKVTSARVIARASANGGEARCEFDVRVQ